MWQPVSDVEYQVLEPRAQALVIACPTRVKTPEIRRCWGSRAAALAPDSAQFLKDVVRDLLANPQIRVIVFHGSTCGREAYDHFWRSSIVPDWGISGEHLTLVRQFVDLFDDDFLIRAPMAPYWPERITYKETT
jgi:hypothetical protein